MYYRIMKCATSMAYIVLLWLTWRFFRGDLDWGFAVSCITLSGFWLVLTRIQMRRLLKTYFDVLSRLQVLVPFWIGIALGGLALIASDNLAVRALTGVEIGWWVYIYWIYRHNRRRYVNQGHGPLPAGCWINPPPQAIEPGDLILTSGRIANQLQESVGHAEVALRLPDGTLGAFSCYMANGAVINDLTWLVSRWLDKGEHYIVLRLRLLPTEVQSQRATQVAQQMITENSQWREATNEHRTGCINALPLPAGWKSWLIEHTKATGYDWMGLFIGRRAHNRWTCIGSCLELYGRLGIKTHSYGTGLLGLGTGLLDPIMPVRFLADPAFRYLSQKDKAAFEGHSC